MVISAKSLKNKWLYNDKQWEKFGQKKKLLFKRYCDNVLYHLMSNGDLIMPNLNTKLLRKGTSAKEEIS
jgi:hypothetical protein